MLGGNVVGGSAPKNREEA